MPMKMPNENVDSVWTGDDFSPGFQINILQTILPLTITAVSFLHLSGKTARDVWVSQRQYRDDHRDYITAAANYGCGFLETNTDDNLRLESKPDRKTQPTLKTGHRKRNLVLQATEVLAVIAELVLNAIAVQSHTDRARLAAIAGLLQWTYIFFLVTLPMTSFENVTSHDRLLEHHKASLYGVSWVVSVLLSRSVLIHSHPWSDPKLRLVELFLISLLFVSSICSSDRSWKTGDQSLRDCCQPREPDASIVSLATFMWVDPIIWRGYQKTYELIDVWDLPSADSAAKVLAKFRQTQTRSRLVSRLLLYNGQALLAQGLWSVCAAVFTFTPTILLKLILEYLEDPSKSSVHAAWFYVILLFLSGFLKAVAEGQASWLGTKIAIRLRAIVVGEIFSKTLRRKATAEFTNTTPQNVPGDDEEGTSKDLGAWAEEEQAAKKQGVTGNATNLMAVDSVKIAAVTSFLHLLWASVPAELVIRVALLFNILGLASVAGFAIMVLLIPIKILITRGFSKVQAKIMAATDIRLKLTADLLQNIRIIKYLTYENRFIYDVHNKRATELKALGYRFTLWTLAVTVYNTTPLLITFISFFIYTVIEHKSLRPSVAFPALSLFAPLRIPLDKLADTIAKVQEAIISAKRVQDYLDESETDKYRQTSGCGSLNGAKALGFHDVTLTWAVGDDKAFGMSGVNLTFAHGQLNIVIGSTGSGKSSLLLALLGEMGLTSGNINFPNSVHRDHPPPRKAKFVNRVAYCAQRPWLLNESIRQNITFGDIMKGRTCILVTHNIALCIRHAGTVSVLSKGKVIAQGSPDIVASLGLTPERHSRLELDVDGPSIPAEKSSPPNLGAMQVVESGRQTGCETEHADKSEDPEILPYVTASPAPESRAIGAIPWKLFKLYFTALGK
ncbi:MAG: hypothetical protein Q9201_000946 [Fulgogasparrea decipioides]